MGRDNQVTWTNVALFGGLLVSTAAGAWTVFQLEFANEQREIDAAAARLERRDRDFSKELEGIRAELLAHRHEFVAQEEHKAFERRVDQYMTLPYLTRNEFEAWRNERDKWLQHVEERIDRVEKRQ
jgi:CHASE1-domain containing sensor protein